MATKQTKQKRPAKDVKISFRLSQDLYDRMLEKMKTDRLTESYVIREALLGFLSNTGFPPIKGNSNLPHKGVFQMQQLKTFTKKSTHPDFPRALTSNEYLSSGENILVNVSGIDGTIWENQIVIPNQEIKVDIIILANKIMQEGSVEVKGDLKYLHLGVDELEWLAPYAKLTVKKPLPEEIKQAEQDLEIYLKEVAELSDMFKGDGFFVVDVTKTHTCALEITKKEVTIRVWVDQMNNGIHYQAGYIENPFSNKRSCKKRETLLKQANLIVDEVLE